MGLSVHYSPDKLTGQSRLVACGPFQDVRPFKILSENMRSSLSCALLCAGARSMYTKISHLLFPQSSVQGDQRSREGHRLSLVVGVRKALWPIHLIQSPI